MRRKADTGIQITAHVTKNMSTENKRSLPSVIYQLVFLCLASYGTIFSVITGIDITVNKKMMLFIIGLSSIAFGLVFMYVKKIHYIIIPVLISIMGISMYCYSSVLDGLQRIYNGFIVSYNSYYNTELKPFKIDSMTTPKNITLCIGLLSIIVIMLITYCLIRSSQAIFYLFITLPFIFTPYLVGLLPSPKPFYCYLIATFTMLTPILAFGKAENKTHKIRFRVNLIMMILTLSVFTIGYIQITPKRYKTMNVASLKKSVQTSVQTYNMNNIFDTSPLQVLLTKTHTASGGMSGGTLGANSSLKFNNKTMLEVKLEHPQENAPLYIKGYIGQKYDQNEWNILDSSEKSKFETLNQEYENKKMNTEGISKEYIQQSSLLMGGDKIDIKNVGNTTSASFVPYSSSELSEISDNGYLRWKEDKLGYIEYKTNFLKMNYYIPGMAGALSDQIAMEDNLIARELLSSAMKKYMVESALGESIDVIKQDADYYEQGDPDIDNPFLDNQVVDMPAIQSWLKEHPELKPCIDIKGMDFSAVIHDIDRFSDYIEFESKAEKLIYETYTKLPKDSLVRVKQLVHKWYKPSRVLLNTHDETLNYGFHQFDQYDRFSDYVEAIKKVKDYLEKNTKYSLNPGELPKGEDFVENFLFQKKKGYCMHYASAATVMFRAMGIPARYVEGYIVTQSDINSRDRKTGVISIKDKNAHAWTEIYMDGYGWMPIEVTPAYERDKGGSIPAEITNALKKGQTKKDDTAAKATPTPKVKPTKKPIANQSNTKNDGNGKSGSKLNSNLPNWLIYVIKVVAISALAIITLVLMIKARSMIIRTKRKRRVINGDNSRRLLAQYYLFEKTMKEYQILYGSTTSVDDLYNACVEKFPEIEKNDLRNYINLALKAKYDCRRVSKEETANADSLYKKFMMQIGANSRRSKRLFLRYIKVLEV